MSAQAITAYYVSSTHWDREWWQPFQHFRYHLVQLMDEVLDVMHQDERYRCFQTDGQSIIVEDYLAMRPARREQLLTLARAGRLRIGPWYTMPDENLPSGESLIRNLEEGIRVAGEFGEPSRVGFSCDIFGHISQLPQILQGFGINTAFIWRGTNDDTHGATFRWQSPDESEVLAYTFPPVQGYGEYARVVRLALDATATFEPSAALPRLIEHLDEQHQRQGLDAVLLFDGIDHLCIDRTMPELLEQLQKARPEVRVQHAGLQEFAAALHQRQSAITKVFKGELRTPGRQEDINYVIPGVLSSRVRLKQANRAIETSLTMWAEPFSNWAQRLVGFPSPAEFLRQAWRYVLENHAHDSICGCSPDQVHKDMEFRFDQARLISQKVTDEALHAIASRVAVDDLEGESFAVVVFNPTQQAIDGPVEVELWFEADTKNTFFEFFGFENKIGFRLYDAQNQEIPYDYLEHHLNRQRGFRFDRHTPQFVKYCVVRVAASLTIPAFGYTTLTCHPTKDRTRYPAGQLVVDEKTLENEYLRVGVDPNGSLLLTDKTSGQEYRSQLVFEDRADIGDGWYHGVAVNDRICSSLAGAADVSLETDGACVARLRVDVRMQVPKDFDFGPAMRRSSETRELVIQNEITLRAGDKHIEVHTTLDNVIKDHRLRVLFASDVSADDYWADSAFDVAQRPIRLPEDNHTYKELAVETAPKANWIAVADEKRGLAVVAPDLPEATVRDAPDRPIALTLLRGFRRTIGTDGEPGGQSLGAHEFRYAIVPLTGAPEATSLATIAQRLVAPPRAIQLSAQQQVSSAERRLPLTAGQLSLEPGMAIITALRHHPQRRHLEIRMYNPGDELITEQLHFDMAVQRAWVTDLEGNEQTELTVSNANTVEVMLRARQIVTVGIALNT